jgi:vacuolar-type H+-ATPase subunit E/Vma4
MQTLGSPASIIAAIREEADAEAERIDGASASDLASIRSENANVGIADREERLAAARRMNEERIAKQEWDGRRAVIEKREKWMQSVVAAARSKWPGGEPATRREQLNALIREAVSRLPHGACDVAVSAGDRDLVDGTVTTAPIAGGCIVTIGDVSFDNSFEARARRLEPEWRNALSGMYTP